MFNFPFKNSEIKYPSKETEIAIKKLEKKHNQKYSKKDIKMLEMLRSQMELILNNSKFIIVNPEGYRELKKEYDNLFSKGVN